MFMGVFNMLDMGKVSYRTISDNLNNYISDSSRAIYNKMTGSGHTPLDYNGLLGDAVRSAVDDYGVIRDNYGRVKEGIGNFLGKKAGNMMDSTSQAIATIMFLKPELALQKIPSRINPLSRR